MEELALLPGGWEGKVLYVDSINHVIDVIETPPRLTPPRLLAGCWEGKVLYVDSMNHVIHHMETINSENLPLPTPC